jgi:hypothetical protein
MLQHLLEAALNIPKPLKVLLLALTLWPPLYAIWFIVMMVTHLASKNFEIVMLLHVLTMLLSVVLLVVYVVHLFKTDHVPRDRKTLWAVTLFLGAPIAMPAYWFAHVWPEARSER